MIYYVTVGEFDPCELIAVVAKTPGRAKALVCNEYPGECDFMDLRVRRVKGISEEGLLEGVIDSKEALKRRLYDLIIEGCEECGDDATRVLNDRVLCEHCASLITEVEEQIG